MKGTRVMCKWRQLGTVDEEQGCKVLVVQISVSEHQTVYARRARVCVVVIDFE